MSGQSLHFHCPINLSMRPFHRYRLRATAIASPYCEVARVRITCHIQHPKSWYLPIFCAGCVKCFVDHRVNWPHIALTSSVSACPKNNAPTYVSPRAFLSRRISCQCGDLFVTAGGPTTFWSSCRNFTLLLLIVSLQSPDHLQQNKPHDRAQISESCCQRHMSISHDPSICIKCRRRWLNMVNTRTICVQKHGPEHLLSPN